MKLLNAITLLALAQYVFFAIMVGSGRKKYNVPAPAVSGHPEFEKLYRIQGNTLELLIVLIPTLYISFQYLPHLFAELSGLSFLLGRMIYWLYYSKSIGMRKLGFSLSAFPLVFLIGVDLLSIAIQS